MFRFAVCVCPIMLCVAFFTIFFFIHSLSASYIEITGEWHALNVTRTHCTTYATSTEVRRIKKSRLWSTNRHPIDSVYVRCAVERIFLARSCSNEYVSYERSDKILVFFGRLDWALNTARKLWPAKWPTLAIQKLRIQCFLSAQPCSHWPSRSNDIIFVTAHKILLSQLATQSIKSPHSNEIRLQCDGSQKHRELNGDGFINE